MMHDRGSLSFLAMTVVTLILISKSTLAEPKLLKEQLVGAWLLISEETTLPNGSKQQPLGSSPRGVLIVDSSGQYALVVERPDRPKFKAAGDYRNTATIEELASAVRGFAANFGTWSTDEAARILIRLNEGALIPNVEGSQTRAIVALSDDELRLTVTSPSGAKNDQVFRRAK